MPASIFSTANASAARGKRDAQAVKVTKKAVSAKKQRSAASAPGQPTKKSNAAAAPPDLQKHTSHAGDLEKADKL